MGKNKKSLPNQVFVYICDYCGGIPVFAVVASIDEIPDDMAGEVVGTYSLDLMQKLSISRSLVAMKK